MAQAIRKAAPAIVLGVLMLAAVLIVSALFADLMGQVPLASALMLGGGAVVVITFLVGMGFILRDIFTS